MTVTNPEFNPSGKESIKQIKEAGAELEEAIMINVAPGRRRAVALTQLEGALMWAVKAAAVGDDE